MTRTHHIILSMICATTLLLGGCASMSRTQCQQIGWEQEGINDANRGLPPQSLSQYNVCVKHYGIPINHKLYHQGWVTGRNQYCIPTNAKTKGDTNNTNVGICTDGNFKQSTQFKDNFKEGLISYWQRTGKADGTNGNSKRDYSAYISIYTKLGIEYNPTEDYDNTWIKGINLYCTKTQGKTTGENGQPYNTVCDSSNNKEQYEAGWDDGSKKFKAKNCTPCKGYSFGLSGTPLPTLCKNDNTTPIAYSSGKKINLISTQQSKQLQQARIQRRNMRGQNAALTQSIISTHSAIVILQQTRSNDIIQLNNFQPNMPQYQQLQKKIQGEYNNIISLQNNLISYQNQQAAVQRRITLLSRSIANIQSKINLTQIESQKILARYCSRP